LSRHNAHYYLPNHRGDTLLVLDEDGDIERKIRYDAFGNVKENTGSFSPTYTFSTKEYLSDAELYLYAYRVYDPIAGRWTQRDPIDYQDSVNLYQFCGNNPVNSWDVNGCVIWKQFFKGVGAAIGGGCVIATGCVIAGGTAPTGIGVAAGGALVVAGYSFGAVGVGTAVAALADTKVDLPTSIGESTSKIAKSAIDTPNPYVNTAIDATGFIIDDIVSPGNGTMRKISAMSTALSGGVMVDDAAERFKKDLEKNQNQDKNNE